MDWSSSRLAVCRSSSPSPPLGRLRPTSGANKEADADALIASQSEELREEDRAERAEFGLSAARRPANK